MNKPTIIATFTPQIWVDDDAVEVEPRGEVTFDVTEAVLSRLPARMNADYEFTDELKELGPEWIQKWDGPFYIEVAHSLEDYLHGMEEYAARLEQELAEANQQIRHLNTFLPDDITVRIELGIDEDEEDPDWAMDGWD